ncbi:TetR/AcrR family transcriptional regulator [Nocardia sp. NPDC059240]|uniref:TetR/AcrR family transcriptional regulator n=1 Tax=Nocardia sp. NPDC059240 TaxID=3346786 RepID=UPI0036A84636
MAESGLRERKKRSTRAEIEQCSLKLFVASGFAETTVDQIAEAADVSSRTVSRYFANKEQIVLDGLIAPELPDAIAEAPAELGPIAAVRAGVSRLYATHPDARARYTLIVRTPVLQNALFDSFRRSTEAFEEGIARRLDRRVDDPMVSTLAGAITGTLLSTFTTLVRSGATEFENYLVEVDRRLGQLDTLFQI